MAKLKEPTTNPQLDGLAKKINVCAAKADDYRVTAAYHLAEAKLTMMARVSPPFCIS